MELSSILHRHDNYLFHKNREGSHSLDKESLKGTKRKIEEISKEKFDDIQAIKTFSATDSKEKECSLMLAPEYEPSQKRRRVIAIESEGHPLLLENSSSEEKELLEKFNFLTLRTLHKNNQKTTANDDVQRTLAVDIYSRDRYLLKEHAQRRMLDLHLKNVLHRGLNLITLRRKATDLQIGRGNARVGTQAAHSSLLPNLEGDYRDAFVNRIYKALLNYSTLCIPLPSELFLQLSALGYLEDQIFSMFNENLHLLREEEKAKGNILNFLLSSLPYQGEIHPLIDERNSLYLNGNQTLIAPTLVNRVDDVVEYRLRDTLLKKLKACSRNEETPVSSTCSAGREILTELVMSKFEIDEDLQKLENIKKFLNETVFKLKNFYEEIMKKQPDHNQVVKSLNAEIAFLRFHSTVNQLQEVFETRRLYTSHNDAEDRSFIFDQLRYEETNPIKKIQKQLSVFDFKSLNARIKDSYDLDNKKKEIIKFLSTKGVNLNQQQLLSSCSLIYKNNLAEIYYIITKTEELKFLKSDFKEHSADNINFLYEKILIETDKITPSTETNKVIDKMLEIKKLSELYQVLKQIEKVNEGIVNIDVPTVIQINEILSRLQENYLCSEKKFIDELIIQLKYANKTFEAQANGTADILCDFIQPQAEVQPLSQDSVGDRKGYDPKILQAQLMRRSFKIQYIATQSVKEKGKEREEEEGD